MKKELLKSTREAEKTVKLEDFFKALEVSHGLISKACASIGLSRDTLYSWRKHDPEFAEKLSQRAKDIRDDYVEERLLDRIEKGDTTATIFYAKTQLKHRGYVEKATPATVPQTPQMAQSSGDQGDSRVMQRLIKQKKDYIVRLLKKQNKYAAELSMQVTIAARLLVRADILSEEIFSADHSPVNIEYSREGNERESISPKEKLFIDISRQSQKALQALGMNIDAKPRKNDEDGFADFMNAFREERQ